MYQGVYYDSWFILTQRGQEEKKTCFIQNLTRLHGHCSTVYFPCSKPSNLALLTTTLSTTFDGQSPIGTAMASHRPCPFLKRYQKNLIQNVSVWRYQGYHAIAIRPDVLVVGKSQGFYFKVEFGARSTAPYTSGDPTVLCFEGEDRRSLPRRRWEIRDLSGLAFLRASPTYPEKRPVDIYRYVDVDICIFWADEKRTSI